MPTEPVNTAEPLVSDPRFRGLSPYLRGSIGGADLRPQAQQLLQEAQAEPDNAALWLALATAMLSLGLRELGLDIQSQALSMARLFHIPATQQPARARLLVLLVPGELSANTPIECLLEDSDIDIDFCFLAPDPLLPEYVPDHDALLVAVSESEANRPYLDILPELLDNWPRPILNAPQFIPRVGREAASQLLADVPGLCIPPTATLDRAALSRWTPGTKHPAYPEWLGLPCIIRPLDAHGGHGLARIDSSEALADYLAAQPEADFFVSPFIDYRCPDQRYRKFRIALIDGQPFACHMAISEHWMIHYLNAGMYEDAGKRAEELAFMEHFDHFVARHGAALRAIATRSGLDYVCLDGAETADGQLLIFEIDHAMIVHAMDSDSLFPYKQIHMAKVRDAFRAAILRRQAARLESEAG